MQFNEFTDAECKFLSNFFEAIRSSMNHAEEAKFGSQFLPTWSMPMGPHEWKLSDQDPGIRKSDIQYYKDTTEGKKRLLKGLPAFIAKMACPNPTLTDQANQDRFHRLVTRLIAHRQQQAAIREKQVETACGFMNYLFTNLDRRGFNQIKFKSFEDQYVDNSRLKARVAIEVKRTGFKLRMWLTQGTGRVEHQFDIKHGETAEQQLQRLQELWNSMVDEISGQGKNHDGDLTTIKLLDRPLTEDEAKFMGAMMAHSNLGQNDKYKIDGDTLIVGYNKVDLHDMRRCAGLYSGMLDQLCEDRETEKAIDAEQKEWTTLMGNKQKEKYTLFKIAKTWPDLTPLMLWMARNFEV